MRILFLLLALAPSLACAGVLESLDSLSADKLEQAGEAIAMALIALGRELDY